MTRYFLFTLAFNSKDRTISGQTTVLQESDTMASNSKIVGFASKHSKEHGYPLDPEDFIVTNIFEFKNSEDYNSFNK